MKYEALFIYIKKNSAWNDSFYGLILILFVHAEWPR